VLLRLAQLLRQNLHELALLESLDMGKLVNNAAAIYVSGSATIFRWYAEAIDKIHGEIAPSGIGSLVLVRREPLGVIGAVVP
jgi:gamma-glutamyl-gamma-aminobutyraldehyde dehydrogenase